MADKNNGIVAGLSWDRLARSVVIQGIVFNSPLLQFAALLQGTRGDRAQEQRS